MRIRNHRQNERRRVGNRQLESHGSVGRPGRPWRGRLERLEDRRVLAAVPFAQETVFAGGLDRSQSVDVADLDADGDLDVVAISGNSVWVLANDGSAQFADPVEYAAGSRSDARGLMLRDVNADGHADLIVGNIAPGEEDNAASLLINDGEGNFGDPLQLISGLDAEFVEAMDAGDTDGDGDVDLILADTRDQRRFLHLVNQGDGTFAEPVDLEFDSASEPQGLVIVDFDGDGDNDIVATSTLEDEETEEFTINHLFWYKNDGAGNFTPSVETDVGDSPRFLDVADFDGDGDQDIVVPEQEAGQISLFVNDGTNVIADPILIDDQLDLVERTRFVDMDQDSDLDVLTTVDGGGLVGYYENDNGSFSDLILISDQTPQASGLATGDMDGDGDLDVMTTSQFHATLNFHENNGDGTWTTTELTGPNTINPEVALFADFDGDGDQDVLGVGSVDFELAWYENTDGLATFDPRSQNLIADYDRAPSETFPLWWDVDVADVDGDGDLDVVTTEPFVRGTVIWYQNDGSGNFDNAFTAGEQLGPTEIDVVDVDGDGDLDLATGQVFGGLYDTENTYVWLENDGVGEFTPRSISTAADSAFAEVASGDIDGDGDIDFLFGDNAFNGTSSVIWYQQFQENGDIVFEEISFIETDREGIFDAQLSDMDGDGDLDAITASYGPDGDTLIRWYENRDGQGDFSTDPTLIGQQFFVSEMILVDVDNDGDTDLLSPNRFEATLEWFDNLGAGTFAPQANVIGRDIITGDTGIPGGDRVMMIVDVADVNGDGRVDVVVPASEENRIALFLSTDEPSEPFDLDGDLQVDIQDVNLLCQDIANESMQYDPNGDGVTDMADMEAMIEDRLGTVFGDSDLNGFFGTSDLVSVFSAGEYEDDIAGNSTYATGDWNCDGDFSTSDLVFTFTLGTYDPDAVAARAATLGIGTVPGETDVPAVNLWASALQVADNWSARSEDSVLVGTLNLPETERPARPRRLQRSTHDPIQMEMVSDRFQQPARQLAQSEADGRETPRTEAIEQLFARLK